MYWERISSYPSGTSSLGSSYKTFTTVNPKDDTLRREKALLEDFVLTKVIRRVTHFTGIMQKVSILSRLSL